MKIIISGAFGHIGSYLIEKFQKNKKVKSILLIDNFYTQRFNSYLKLNKKKIELIDKDINYFDLNSINKKYDCFIHLSAITNAAESFKIKKELFSNNLGGTNRANMVV